MDALPNVETRIVFRNTLVVLATIAGAYIVVRSLHILILFLIAVLIASAVRPAVRQLQAWRIPGSAAVLIVYGGILLLLGLLAVLVFPPVFTQLADYLTNEDRLEARVLYVNRWVEMRLGELRGNPVELVQDDALREGVQSLIAEFENVTPAILNNLGSTLGEAVLVFVLGLYWLTSRDKMADFLETVLSLRSRFKANQIFQDIENAVGSYVRGVVFVAVFVGLANLILLLLFRVPNAGTYAFIIGISTMLPVVGGFIGGGGASLLAALTSPAYGLFVFISFVVVQQAETHYLTPRVMGRSMKIDPLLVIIGILAGFALYGVVGGIIAVPILGTITILLRYLVIEPQREQVAHKVEGGAVILNTGDTAPDDSETPTPGGILIGR